MPLRPAAPPKIRPSISRLLLYAGLASGWLLSFVFLFPLFVDLQRELAAMRPLGPIARVFGPCDFVMFWSAGQMLAHHAVNQLYDVAAVVRWEASNPHNPGLQLQWIYPPTALPLARLFASLPFFAALWAWIIGSLAAAVALLRAAGLPWPVIAASVLSPAMLLSTGLGQLGLVAASVSAFTLCRLAQRPAASGAVLGLLAYKPQSALLVAWVLLVRRQWPAIAAAAGIVAGAVLLTLALYGDGVWRSFIEHGLPVSRTMLNAAFPGTAPPAPASYEDFGSSVFWMVRSFGGGIALAGLCQLAAMVAAILLCGRAWLQPEADLAARLALTGCLSAFMSPYGFLYDLGLANIGLATLVHRQRRLERSDVLLWIWPLPSLLIAFRLHLELTPLVLGLSAWRAYRRL